MSPFVKAASYALQDQPVVNAGKSLWLSYANDDNSDLHQSLYDTVIPYTVKGLLSQY